MPESVSDNAPMPRFENTAADAAASGWPSTYFGMDSHSRAQRSQRTTEPYSIIADRSAARSLPCDCKLENASLRILVLFVVSLIAIFASGCGSSGTSSTRTKAPVFPVRVVSSFPHDPNAFTQGLEIEGGKLYESTGREGFSSVRHVDLESGEVTLKQDLPDDFFGEGLTIMGDQIYQITYKNRICFVYEKDTLKKTKQFNYSGEGWGLANDGKHLFMTDKTSTISIRDPETFEVLRKLRVKDGRKSITELNELEYFDGHIWANIWRQDKIAKIDPKTGAVVAWLDCSKVYPAKNRDNPQEDVLNGIARDAVSGRLFITGKMWPKLYEIEILDK